jgi:hypothetical protein
MLSKIAKNRTLEHSMFFNGLQTMTTEHYGTLQNIAHLNTDGHKKILFGKT